VTQLQEQTITFVPKFWRAVWCCWCRRQLMLGQAIAFTHHLFDMIPSLLS